MRQKRKYDIGNLSLTPLKLGQAKLNPRDYAIKLYRARVGLRVFGLNCV